MTDCPVSQTFSPNEIKRGIRMRDWSSLGPDMTKPVIVVLYAARVAQCGVKVIMFCLYNDCHAPHLVA